MTSDRVVLHTCHLFPLKLSIQCSCAHQCYSKHGKADNKRTEDIEHIVFPSFDGIWLTDFEQNQLLRTDDSMASCAGGSNSLVLLEMVTWVNNLEEMRRGSDSLNRAFFPAEEICFPLLQPTF